MLQECVKASDLIFFFIGLQCFFMSCLNQSLPLITHVQIPVLIVYALVVYQIPFEKMPASLVYMKTKIYYPIPSSKMHALLVYMKIKIYYLIPRSKMPASLVYMKTKIYYPIPRSKIPVSLVYMKNKVYYTKARSKCLHGQLMCTSNFTT